MRRLLPIMIALMLAQAAAAQSNIDANGDSAGAQAVLDRFLALNAASQLASPEGQALMAGELAEARRPTVGPLPAPDRLLLLSDGRAVARFPAQGEDRPDIYVYLRRNEGGAWTINAYRALALPRFVTDLRNGLRAMADAKRGRGGDARQCRADDAVRCRASPLVRGEPPGAGSASYPRPAGSALRRGPVPAQPRSMRLRSTCRRPA